MRYEHQASLIRDEKSPISIATVARQGHYNPALNIAPTLLVDGTPEQPAKLHAYLPLTAPRRYRSILVPVDGNPFAEHALPLALGIARRAGASVQVVHVHSPLESAYKPGELYSGSSPDGFLKQRQQAYLKGLVRHLAKVTAVPVRSLLIEGRDTADSLLESARAGADLVVMATHGRGAVRRFLLGGLADVLMRRLSIPMLFTRGYNAPADLTGDPLMRHLLIALNGSESAEQVLNPALALGALWEADHTFLRIVPPTVNYFGGYPDGYAAHPLALQQQEARSYLRSVVQRFGARSPTIRPRIVLDDRSTGKAILSFAQAHDVDVIALATRGRGGLARLFQGSVADHVVRHSPVPVLVSRPDAG
jgi:nucleotide-binding universal stress UspA family protein